MFSFGMIIYTKDTNLDTKFEPDNFLTFCSISILNFADSALFTQKKVKMKVFWKKVFEFEFYVLELVYLNFVMIFRSFSLFLNFQADNDNKRLCWKYFPSLPFSFLYKQNLHIYILRHPLLQRLLWQRNNCTYTVYHFTTSAIVLQRLLWRLRGN